MQYLDVKFWVRLGQGFFQDLIFEEQVSNIGEFSQDML